VVEVVGKFGDRWEGRWWGKWVGGKKDEWKEFEETGKSFEKMRGMNKARVVWNDMDEELKFNHDTCVGKEWGEYIREKMQNKMFKNDDWKIKNGFKMLIIRVIRGNILFAIFDVYITT